MENGDAVSGCRDDLFRQIVENMDAACWVLDAPSGNVVYVNTAFGRVYDRAPEDARHREQLFSAWVHPEDRHFLKEALEKETAFNLDYRLRLPAGGERWLRSSAFPIVGGDGVVELVVGFSRDVTPYKEASRIVRENEERTRRVQKLEAVGTLAAGIAHDFNNILGAILLNTELACRRAGDRERTEPLLRKVIAGIHRARALVRQMLMFSHRSDGVRRPLRLSPFVKELAKFFQVTLPASVTVKTDISDLEEAVSAAPEDIHQLILNLVTNAAEALDDNTGEITIALGVADGPIYGTTLQEGHYITLTVTDTGRGMTPDIERRIFDPYFTTRPGGDGSGMGLAVVHGIVSELRGVITVETRPKRGSTFRVYIPAAEEEPAETSADMPYLLVAEDEPDLLTVVTMVLEGEGFKVSGWTDPSQAYDAFRKAPESFRAVLLDFSMPGLNGVELASRITSVRPDLPVLLMTGYDEGIDARIRRASGIRDIVPKPFSSRELTDAIRRACGYPRST